MTFKIKPAFIYGSLLFCMVVFIFTPVYSQLNSGNLSQYTEKDGLPDVQVNGVLVDKSGYVWTGTGNGLVRYDGYEFKRFYFNPNDTGSIRGLVVWSLFEDHEGKIWVGTSPSFLNVYNPATKAFRQYNFTHLIKHPANVELNIQVMCEDNKGRMYFGINTYFGDPVSSALLYKDENDTTIKRFTTPDSLNIQNVYRIINDRIGNVWLFTYSGIFKIDTKRHLSRFRSLDAELINSEYPGDLQFDKAGHLWIITQKLRVFDFNLTTGSYKTWYPDSSITSKEFDFLPRKIVIDNDDNIWLGTNNGIQFFNRQTGKFSRFNNGVKKDLEHTPVVDLTLDDFGTLWIGSYKDGLIKYENKPQLKSYSHNDNEKNSLTTGWANFICESSDGKIWITTGGSRISSGLNILDTQTGKIQPIRYSGIIDRLNGVSAFWESAPGEFYLGAFNGLYTFSEKDRKLKLVRLPGIPDTSVITFHYKDSRQNEWICTYNGVYKKTNGTPEYIHYDLSQVKESDATSNRVSMVYESKKHGLWILTDNGLFLYNYTNDKIERHGNDKSKGNVFITQDINSIYEDTVGNVWAGMWQGGLSRYNVETKQIKTFTINDGLPSMSVQAILANDKNNFLWLSTFDGLSRFNIKTEQFNNYTIADGLQSQLFADASFLKTSAGLFAFGGSNGVTIFNPAEINTNSIPPKVFLTDLKLFNKSIIPGDKSILKKPVNETGAVDLAYNQNNISIEFLAIHYSNPAKNRYTYKLENYDNEWRDIGNQHVAFYPNLPPGKYLFQVKAANDKGVWNNKGATLKITVNPPWWKTTWAYIIYGLLLVAIAFGVDRYFRGRLIEKERERSRARELEQAKEIEKA
ncbi:MAG: two-component regulator propeller domain-containing protein, partial [Ginsengibacter sp.]